ncbi:MAG TPA: hypothetical protein VID47_14420, partial [Actinomycetota bacterium]
VTVRGVEWRSLDFRASAQYVPNTGGGISVQVGNSTPPHPYFEAAMRVPAGALINQVTFYLQDCGTQIVGHPGALADWYFAAYNPTKATGHFILPVARTPASMWDCDLHSWVRAVSPPVKVLATTSYVAGVDPHSVTSGNEPPADPKLIIEGAKVRYTCPNGC